MKKALLILLFGLSIISFSQDISDWSGHYVGDLTSLSASGRTMSYHMELKIDQINDSTYNWVIIYGEDSLRQERKYLVKATEKENHFILDEQNSILLNFTLIENSFFSVFEVDGHLLHVEYRLNEDEIKFILTSSNSKEVTGGTMHEGEQMPIVTTYLTWTTQLAILKKVD